MRISSRVAVVLFLFGFFVKPSSSERTGGKSHIHKDQGPCSSSAGGTPCHPLQALELAQ
jgi:hypothetical protein